MSENLKSIHVRLSSEAHKALCALGEVDNKDNAELARIIIEEYLLGRVHTLMLTARVYSGLGFTGTLRDSEGKDRG